MLGVAFVLLLIVVGVGVLYGLWRLLGRVDEQAGEVIEQERARALAREAEPEISGGLGPDGVVYLAAHRFVPSGAPRSTANIRRRAYAPITGEEVEPRQMAEQLLHASLVSLAEAGRLELRVAEREPSFMPPFPHKRWELRVVRTGRLVGSPTAEALDCAFDVSEQRTAKRGGDVQEGIPLDELVEDMLRVMRQELSFWEKAGIYADIRQYVEAALIDQGYLIAPAKETWFDRLRHIRPTVNEAALDEIERHAAELESRLSEFRQVHGSERAVSADDAVPGGCAEQVDEALLEAKPPFPDLPLHDGLRISLYEAMMAIRQLEPSEDVGV
ncbi:MAG: hypothetical protein FJX74_08630 [Armatimonadetes bacterium]|nr:hypothetical protein [Armatimonadota bacterium]